jgi:hypothetical protein
VNEADLDCLFCMTWELTGGRGSLEGTHGRSGRGGSGGRDVYSWSKYDPSTQTTDRRDAGRHGSSGNSGMSPTTWLPKRRDGRYGSASICAVETDGSARTYSRRYLLMVMDYEIVDESEDGINEPGEHLMIKNLVALN